jgi:hypothetical protein
VVVRDVLVDQVLLRKFRGFCSRDKKVALRRSIRDGKCELR